MEDQREEYAEAAVAFDEALVISLNDVMAADDLARELVHVPEWGGAVWVRGLTGGKRADYMSRIVEIDEKGKARAKVGASDIEMVFLSVENADGSRFFQSRDQVKAKSARALKRIVEAAERLSGMDDAADARAEGN